MGCCSEAFGVRCPVIVPTDGCSEALGAWFQVPMDDCSEAFRAGCPLIVPTVGCNETFGAGCLLIVTRDDNSEASRAELHCSE